MLGHALHLDQFALFNIGIYATPPDAQYTIGLDKLQGLYLPANTLLGIGLEKGDGVAVLADNYSQPSI